jgi:hypothetical protein
VGGTEETVVLCKPNQEVEVVPTEWPWDRGILLYRIKGKTHRMWLFSPENPQVPPGEKTNDEEDALFASQLGAVYKTSKKKN